MEERGDEVHTSTTEASAGSKEGVVRWVLIIGLILAVVFLSLIWMTGALTQDPEDSQTSVSRKIQEGEAAADDARGEPTMPALGDDAASASPSSSASAMPGDAPAGDPTNSAQ